MANLHMPFLASDDLPGTARAIYDMDESRVVSVCRKMLDHGARNSNLRRTVEEEYAIVVAALRMSHRCRICRFSYTLWDTVGRMQCRSHPGSFDASARKWRCCNMQPADANQPNYEKPHAFGCTPCDHQSMVHDRPGGHISTELQYLPLPVAAILPNLHTRTITSYRVDFAANPHLSSDAGLDTVAANDVEIHAFEEMSYPDFLFGPYNMCNFVVGFQRVQSRHDTSTSTM